MLLNFVADALGFDQTEGEIRLAGFFAFDCRASNKHGFTLHDKVGKRKAHKYDYGPTVESAFLCL